MNSLTLYKKKRNFKVTPEPKGKIQKKKKSLIFTVQQHAASHLHYDFRLEMEGVLKSWAVPKGPSMNPDDKRLAMRVEDHPFDYKDFEGTIPEGNYGAGNVIVWDYGNYHALDGADSNDEKKLLAGLHKGHISFILEGKKLKGEFSLVKLKSANDNSWLLIKKKDKFASDSDILKKDKSVISGKKLKMREKNQKSETLKAKVNAKNKIKKLIPPMLAELVSDPFDNSDWIFETKYDGYRALAAINGKGSVELYSRNLLSFNTKYPEVVNSLKSIKHECLLDGEVVVEDNHGRSHFQLLQKYQETSQGKLMYYVFDLLQLDGKELTQLPLLQRKELLSILINKYKLPGIIYSDHIRENGKKYFEQAIKKNFEGIIAKNIASIYTPGIRSRNWKKIKIVKQQEVIIVGITEPKGGRKHFGSLLLGIYEKNKLEYCGHCGTGFNSKTLQELYNKFKSAFTSHSPFDKPIKANGSVQWMKPKFVCEVKFTEWTSSGSMRHPVFLGLRMDKEAKEIKREIPKSDPPKSNRKTGRIATVKKNSPSLKISKSTEPSDPGQNDLEIKIGTKKIKLTNQNKIYFSKDKITKGDLVEYYKEISPFILPYLKDRPQSLNRFPNGITGMSFYQKDIDVDKVPDWIKTEKVFSESNKKNIHYAVCNDEATLLYLVNLGCIEINPWNSRIDHLHNPDWFVIDLDPEKIHFKEVVKTAIEVHRVLEKLEIESYCKTSGATGLHIYVPLAAKYNYDDAKNFAHLIAQIVNKKLPKTTSILRMPAKRQGKVYIDFLQNRRGQTLAAPYSVRPKPGATVSTPLEWKEVNEKLSPSSFTIKNILERIGKKGDLWKPVIGKGANLEKALKQLKD